MVGSVAWAGIFIYTFQYGISMAPTKERSMYLAFQSAALGLVMAGSYFISGGVVKLMEGMEPIHVGPYVWKDLQLLFCLAGLGRLLSLTALIRMPGASRK